jgi:fatty acid-binding protein DegV
MVISVGGGKISPVAPAWGARQLLSRLVALGTKALAEMRRPAVIIPHAAAIGVAEALAGRLAEACRAPDLEVHIVDASPALGVHAGLGAFGVALLDMDWVDRRIEELREG